MIESIIKGVGVGNEEKTLYNIDNYNIGFIYDYIFCTSEA